VPFAPNAPTSKPLRPIEGLAPCMLKAFLYVYLVVAPTKLVNNADCKGRRRRGSRPFSIPPDRALPGLPSPGGLSIRRGFATPDAKTETNTISSPLRGYQPQHNNKNIECQATRKAGTKGYGALRAPHP
jgi:hypothetical protein